MSAKETDAIATRCYGTWQSLLRGPVQAETITPETPKGEAQQKLFDMSRTGFELASNEFQSLIAGTRRA